jgi:hypothetical protein
MTSRDTVRNSAPPDDRCPAGALRSSALCLSRAARIRVSISLGLSIGGPATLIPCATRTSLVSTARTVLGSIGTSAWRAAALRDARTAPGCAVADARAGTAGATRGAGTTGAAVPGRTSMPSTSMTNASTAATAPRRRMTKRRPPYADLYAGCIRAIRGIHVLRRIDRAENDASLLKRVSARMFSATILYLSRFSQGTKLRFLSRRKRKHRYEGRSRDRVGSMRGSEKVGTYVSVYFDR